PTVAVHHGSHQFEFSDLKVGDRVHVRAELVANVLPAKEGKLQNPGDEDESGDPTSGTPLSVDGLVSLLSAGACPSKTFNIGTQAVQNNCSTVFAAGMCRSSASCSQACWSPRKSRFSRLRPAARGDFGVAACRLLAEAYRRTD